MDNQPNSSENAPTQVPQYAQASQGCPPAAGAGPQIPQGWVQTPQAPPQGYSVNGQPVRGYPPHVPGYTPAERPAQAGYTPQQRTAWIVVAVLLAMFTLKGNAAPTAPTPTAPGAPTQQAPTQQAPNDRQVMAAVAQPITQFIDGVQAGNADQALSAWDESRRREVAMHVGATISNVQQSGGVVYGNRNINIQSPPAGGRCMAVVTYTAQFPNGMRPVYQTYTLVQRGDLWFIDRLDG